MHSSSSVEMAMKILSPFSLPFLHWNVAHHVIFSGFILKAERSDFDWQLSYYTGVSSIVKRALWSFIVNKLKWCFSQCYSPKGIDISSSSDKCVQCVYFLINQTPFLVFYLHHCSNPFLHACRAFPFLPLLANSCTSCLFNTVCCSEE